MNRFHTILRAVGAILKNPGSITRVLPLEDEWKRKVRTEYGFIDGLPTIDLLDLFPGFHITVEPYSFLEGTSTVIDIALLKALAARRRECRYLEIGTWKGESAANVAQAAGSCVTISLSDAEMRERGFSDDYIRVHGFFSEGLGNVRHVRHDSRTFDFQSLGEKFDLIFIDGDHSPGAVETDTRNAFRMLRDDTSVIVWHDYGWSPETVRWDVLAGILAGCPAEQRRHLYHVSNTLCAVYIKSEFVTRITKYPEVPDKKFRITIEAERL